MKYHIVPAEWVEKQIQENKEHREIFDDLEENDFVNGEQSAYSEIKDLFPAIEVPDDKRCNELANEIGESTENKVGIFFGMKYLRDKLFNK